MVSLAKAVPTGALGAIVSLSVVNNSGSGSLRLGVPGKTPNRLGLQWTRTGDHITSEVTCPISAARTLGVRSTPGSGTTHLVVDVIGHIV